MKALLKRFIPCFGLALWLAALNAGVSFAQALPAAELVDNAREYDGRKVVYAGEVIGDIMKRGQGAWMNIKDAELALGVWAPLALAEKVGLSGGFKSSGDLVRVEGEFRRACPEHGGSLDIHAYSLDVVKKGEIIDRSFDPGKKKASGILFGAVLVLWILKKLLRR